MQSTLNRAQMMENLEGTGLQQFDTETVAARTGIPKPTVALWLLRLARRGDLQAKKGRFSRECNYKGGRANGGFKKIYLFAKNGRRFLDWQKATGPRGEPLLERTPRKDLEKMPFDRIVKLLSEAWPKTGNRVRAFSRVRNSIDFALNLLVKKHSTIREQYDDAHTLNLTKDQKIGSLGKELQELRDRREDMLNPENWGPLVWARAKENDDPRRVDKVAQEELAKRDKTIAEKEEVIAKGEKIITELKEQLVIKEADEKRAVKELKGQLAIMVEGRLQSARKNDELENDLFLARRAEKIALDDEEKAISEQIRLLDESFQQSKRIVELTGGPKAASELDDLKLAEQETSNRMGWLAMVRMAKAIQSEGPPQPDQIARDQKQEAARIMVLIAGLLDSMDTQARRLKSLGHTVTTPEETIAELQKELQKRDKTIAGLEKRAETYEEHMWIAEVVVMIAIAIASGLGVALYLEVREHQPRQEPVKSAEPVPPWFGSKFRPMT